MFRHPQTHGFIGNSGDLNGLGLWGGARGGSKIIEDVLNPMIFMVLECGAWGSGVLQNYRKCLKIVGGSWFCVAGWGARK